MKAFIDGALGSRGAALHESYCDDHNNCGLILISKEEFSKLAKNCYQNNFQLNTHAIGDRATDYLFGEKAIPVYRSFYILFVFIGAIASLEAIWAFGDAALGFMTFPNLISIILLSPILKKLTTRSAPTSPGLRSPWWPLEAQEEKWSKGKTRDKLNNLVWCDKGTYDKLYKEVPTYNLITHSIVSWLKVRESLARRALTELM